MASNNSHGLAGKSGNQPKLQIRKKFKKHSYEEDEMLRHIDALSMPSTLGILRNVGGKNRPNMSPFHLDYRLKTDGVFSGKIKGAPYTHQGSSPGVGPSIDHSRSTQKSTIQQSAARKAKKRDVRTLGLGPVE